MMGVLFDVLGTSTAFVFKLPHSGRGPDRVVLAVVACDDQIPLLPFIVAPWIA